MWIFNGSTVNAIRATALQAAAGCRIAEQRTVDAHVREYFLLAEQAKSGILVPPVCGTG